MSFNIIRPTIAAVLAVATLAPVTVVAQQVGTPAQLRENAQQTSALRARIETTEARVAEARRTRAITPTRAATLRKQIAQTRHSMARLLARQGFVSAAEFASYNRTLGAIDMELDRRGVARSYGNDALMAPGKR